MISSSPRRLCIVRPTAGALSETFIDAHIERLPAKVSVVHGASAIGQTPSVDGRPVLRQAFAYRACRKVARLVLRRSWEWEATSAYVALLRRIQADAVLAEYGPTGVRLLDACRIAGVPLVVHFHGYDAARHDVLQKHQQGYQRLFESAAAIIAPSRHMRSELINLGAPAEKVIYNPYGVDCTHFRGADPGRNAPHFLAVGRFVEKKAPHLTLLAFAEVHRSHPAAHLRMIGDGPLLPLCRQLAQALGIADSVTFLGAQSPAVVRAEIQNARAFVQHSIRAPDGDCEGTPLAILEASAGGLPVVSTRHAGIPDVIVDGTTGFLVDELDVQGMAAAMERVVEQPFLAAQMGAAGRERILAEFAVEKSIARLWSVIERAMAGADEKPIAARSTSGSGAVRATAAIASEN